MAVHFHIELKYICFVICFAEQIFLLANFSYSYKQKRGVESKQ